MRLVVVAADTKPCFIVDLVVFVRAFRCFSLLAVVRNCAKARVAGSNPLFETYPCVVHVFGKLIGWCTAEAEITRVD